MIHHVKTPLPDIALNRRARKWSRREQIQRVLWALASPLFSLSPRPFFGWRRFLLRAFGAKVGARVHIYPSVRIAMPWNLEIGDDAGIGDRVILYSLGVIFIGKSATVSQGAHLCAGTHDYRDRALGLLKRPISIEDGAWVCADAFIGPGVAVGARAIVGARAVAMKNVPPNAIVAGNPARLIKYRNG